MVSTFAFLEGIGGPELLLIMFVILVLFGANRLPELARGFGKSMREFKKAASGVEQEFKQAMDVSETEEEKRRAAAAARKSEASLRSGEGAAGEGAPKSLPPPPSTKSRIDDGLGD